MKNQVWLAVVCTIVAWFIGMIADMNTNIGGPAGFFMLRVLFPLLVIGGFILSGQKKDERHKDDEDRDHE